MQNRIAWRRAVPGRVPAKGFVAGREHVHLIKYLINHSAMRGSGIGVTVLLGFVAVTGFAPLCAKTITLGAPPVHVNDGDTFEADLNGNGRLDLPRERVRLLYVDTPELSASHKGKDLRFGLPARAFLADKLKRPPITLLIDHLRPQDNYGRTLALVHAGKTNLNLQLIRLGHSYFDTRFAFPAAYPRFAEAEAAAFRERLGIWSHPPSRSAYLARLRKEGKTPASPGNALYVSGSHATHRADLAAYRGRFLQMHGKLLKGRRLRKGAWLLNFRGRRAGAPLRVFVPSRVNRKLRVQAWAKGALIVMDGFAQTYRGKPQLRLHWGTKADGGTANGGSTN